jgi:hypothetical protein
MVLAQKGEGGRTMKHEPDEDWGWVWGYKNYEDMKTHEKLEQIALAILYPTLAIGMAALIFLGILTVSVELYLKVKNNGSRQVHAVEVVKP